LHQECTFYLPIGEIEEGIVKPDWLTVDGVAACQQGVSREQDLSLASLNWVGLQISPPVYLLADFGAVEARPGIFLSGEAHVAWGKLGVA